MIQGSRGEGSYCRRWKPCNEKSDLRDERKSLPIVPRIFCWSTIRNPRQDTVSRHTCEGGSTEGERAERDNQLQQSANLQGGRVRFYPSGNRRESGQRGGKSKREHALWLQFGDLFWAGSSLIWNVRRGRIGRSGGEEKSRTSRAELRNEVG